MKKILIVDDSALMRRVLSDIIQSDKRLIVPEVATNGLEALERVTETANNIDAVILDINMPKMNGIEFLEAVSKFKLRFPIIVVSTVAKEGAKETIRCLELGAFDFVTKPDSFIEAKGDSFKYKIVTTICSALKLPVDESIFKKAVSTETKSDVKKTQNVIASTLKAQRKKHNVVGKGAKKLVALACSTGGPKALQSVIPMLPANLDAPVVIVQHMPEGFTNSLAMRLDETSKIKVKEAEDGEIIKLGVVYIAKGGSQLRLEKVNIGYKLCVTVEAARNGLKPCADIMYESLVLSDFDDITCVVLTGMGADGTLGINRLNDDHNIYVISQDENSCTVYGMPKVIHDAGLSDEVVSLDDVAEAIVKNVGVH